ncbi:MAG TPA: ATP-binding protein [bacterium]|nr:ATP-binding protein [bacterium]
MMAPLRLGLRVRLAVGASLLVLGVSAAGAILFASLATHELERQFTSTMGSLTQNLSRNAAHGVFIESGEVLDELASNLASEPDVERVIIYNEKGLKIDEAPAAKVPFPQKLEEAPASAASHSLDTPVMYETERGVSAFSPFGAAKEHSSAPKRIGTVKVVYRRDRLDAQIARVRIEVFFAALVITLLGTAIAIWIAGRIIGPLGTLSAATAAVAAGNFETKVAESGGDEIAALAGSFNRMIDALKVSRATLAETYAELARKERLATLGQFTAVIAHELRNPLGVILSSAQVIANPKRTAEQKEKAAEFIVAEVRRLNTDLTSFLNFARPKPPDVRPVSLVELARRAIDAWRGQPGASASGDAHPDAPTPEGVVARVHDGGAPLAAADPDQVHQLLLNLLFNAAQALSVNSSAGRGGHIDVTAAIVDGRPALVVADDGPGIPDDVRARIFEPFFTTRKRGSGLGLAVVEQIARAHGGEVRLETAAGRGTTFTIVFNAADASLAASTARSAS